MPRSDRATAIAACALRDGRPVPADLVPYIAVGQANNRDDALQKRIDEAKKIHFLASGMTWVISSEFHVKHHEVLTCESFPQETASPPAPLPRVDLSAQDVGTSADWIKEQPLSMETEGQAY